MTTLIRIPGIAKDTTLPIWREDQFLREGTLMLIDPTNPSNPWDSGVPAAGAVVPNLAANFALAVAKTGSVSAFNAGVTDSVSGKPRCLVERTSRGGIHMVIDPSALPSPTIRSWALTNNPVRAYIEANPTHKYFVGFSGQTTRVKISTNRDLRRRYAGYSGTNSSPFGGLHESDNGIVGSPSTNVIGERVSPPKLGIRVADAAFSLMATSAATSDAFFLQSTFSDLAGNPSTILYSMVIHDMTVSGASYSELDTHWNARHKSLVETKGGRYYGDTFTDPATVTA